jgi:hypothetical protein
MSNTDGPFDWEDENDPVFISDEDYDDEETTPLEEFRKMMIQDRIITDFIDEAWEFGGIATISDVINHIERKIGWRTEIIADRGALDDYMFYDYSQFNPHLWDLYTNSDEHQELVIDVAYESEVAMHRFVKRAAGKLTTKDRFKALARKLLRNLVRFFD